MEIIRNLAIETIYWVDHAIMVATDARVDLAEVERWSHHEGMAKEFELIRNLLQTMK